MVNITEESRRIRDNNKNNNNNNNNNNNFFLFNNNLYLPSTTENRLHQENQLLRVVLEN